MLAEEKEKVTKRCYLGKHTNSVVHLAQMSTPTSVHCGLHCNPRSMITENLTWANIHHLEFRLLQMLENSLWLALLQSLLLHSQDTPTISTWPPSPFTRNAPVQGTQQDKVPPKLLLYVRVSQPPTWHYRSVLYPEQKTWNMTAGRDDQGASNLKP